MAQNKTLELSIKIAGKVDKSLTAAINNTNTLMGSLSTTMSKVGTVGLASMGALATGTVAALATCTKEAAKFENYMSDVVKVVDGMADATGKASDLIADNGKTFAENYSLMEETLKDLSTQIPYTFEDLTRLAAAAGQSGKTFEDLTQTDFLKNIAMWGTAMDVSADQAGDWGAKWEQAFNMNHDQVMELADVINYLGNNYATTAAEIAQSVNQAASMGQIAGVDPTATAAIAASMQAMGVSTDRVGTTISRIYTNISKGSNATKAQKEMWQELGFTAEGIAKSMQSDGIGTLVSVFEAVNELPDERKIAALNTLFGQWAIEGGAKITQNLSLLTGMLEEVSDESIWTGSMEKEFIIKATTPEAIETMLASTKSALMDDIGSAFLPAYKELGLASIDFLNTIRNNMPELEQLAGTLGELASGGVEKLGIAMENALPYIQKGLDYLVNNGDQVAKTIGTVAAAFVGMKFAPGIESLLGGAGSLLFGSSGGSSGKRSGGLFSGIASLFRKGQNLATDAGTVLNIGLDAASMSNGGFFQKLVTGLGGAFAGAQNIGGINSRQAGTVASAWNNISAATRGTSNWASGVAGAASGLWNTLNGATVMAHANASTGQGSFAQNLIANLFGKSGRQSIGSGVSGLLGSIFSPLKNTGVGQYAGNVASSIGSFSGNASSLLFTLLGKSNTSAPGASLLGNLAGGITGTLSSGLGVLGSVWGPIASGFGSIFAGAAPVIGVISAIIAVVSILGDNLDGIRGIVENVFGEQGVAIFDKFIGVLQNVGDFISGLFVDGGVAEALAPLRDTITNLFGDNAGAAFDGLTTILQSVMGVVGQIVSFANTTVKPIIQEIFGFLTTTVFPTVLNLFTQAAPYIAGIISGIGSAVMTGMQLIGSAIQAALPIVEKIVSVIMSIASVVVPAVLAGLNALASGIGPILEGVKAIFDGLISFITGVFTGNWSQAWEGVKQIFSGAFNALEGLLKTPVNAVIALINKAISGINGLGLTIPDWVPVIGGKSFSINIPEIPMLAKGGFTDGVSIAGEAGREAVISFQRGVRTQNIATWAQAGRLLGVSAEQALSAVSGGNAVELQEVGGGADDNSGGSFTFAPNIIIQGNADKDVIDEALRQAKEQFEAWYEQMVRKRARVSY